MKLLLDVNISPLWIEFLRSAGHHAVHWCAVGDARAPDREIASYAGEQGFVILRGISTSVHFWPHQGSRGPA